MDFTPENITAVGTALAGVIVAVTALVRVLRSAPSPVNDSPPGAQHVVGN